MEQLKMICEMKKIPETILADGYSIRFFQKGDETVWTEICKNGLLGDNDGVESFGKCMSEIGLVPERDCFFVIDKCGNAVATCTAYIMENGDGNIHMVAAKPEARGKGMGYAMTCFGLNKLDKELCGEKRLVRLSTDDFRVSAVKAYIKAGFQPVLYDVDMDKRWKALCDKLDIHGVEMLDAEGEETEIVL